MARIASSWIARFGFWLSLLGAPLLFLFAMQLLDRERPIDPRYRINTALVMQSDRNDPPPATDPAWKQVTLPDRQRGESDVTHAWYRITVPSPEKKGPWAVYLPTPRANVAVFVNGIAIGDGGAFERPLPYHYTPLYFAFPGELLQADNNSIDVHVANERSRTQLRTLYIGPDHALRPSWQFAQRLKVDFIQVNLVAIFISSVTMAGLYLLRRRDSAYGWYAFALLFWGLHVGQYLIAKPLTTDHRLFVALSYVLLGGFVLCSALFVNRFVAARHTRLEAALGVFGVLGAVALLAVASVNLEVFLQLARYLWVPALNLIGVYIVSQLVRANLRHPSREYRLLLIVSFLVLVVGIRDHLWEIGVLRLGSVYYLAYTVSFVLLVFGAILMYRFGHALDEAERLNVELERRVLEKTKQIEANYLRLQELERERLLGEERERIMRDMHDGVGGQLIHALALVRRESAGTALREVLQSCLDDMRLIVDSVNPVHGDLLAVLANFRGRIQRNLERAGIAMDWQVQDLPGIDGLGPHRILQITRILQEVVTNVIKHADASAITLRTETLRTDAESAIVIEVIDNGRGIQCNADADARTGNGIRNMRHRAAYIGAKLDIDSSQRGTRVRLTLRSPARASPNSGTTAVSHVDHSIG